MQIQIIGKHIELGDALRGRIEAGLESAVSKYFDRSADGHVTVSEEGHQTVVDANVHLQSGVTLNATGKGNEPYSALDDALEKIEKRVRRYKRRLKDHHREDRTPFPSERVSSAVLQSSDDEDDSPDNGHDAAPLTVAETSTIIRTMSVSEAVMQLEIGEAAALMFRNARHEGLNMVYRRPDGHIGWVDPSAPAKQDPA